MSSKKQTIDRNRNIIQGKKLITRQEAIQFQIRDRTKKKVIKESPQQLIVPNSKNLLDNNVQNESLSVPKKLPVQKSPVPKKFYPDKLSNEEINQLTKENEERESKIILRISITTALYITANVLIGVDDEIRGHNQKTEEREKKILFRFGLTSIAFIAANILIGIFT